MEMYAVARSEFTIGLPGNRYANAVACKDDMAQKTKQKRKGSKRVKERKEKEIRFLFYIYNTVSDTD